MDAARVTKKRSAPPVLGRCGPASIVLDQSGRGRTLLSKTAGSLTPFSTLDDLILDRTLHDQPCLEPIVAILRADSTRWLVVARRSSRLRWSLLDALSKWLIVRVLGPGGARDTIHVVGDFIELHYALNRGIAFGLLERIGSVAGLLVGIVIVPLVGRADRSRRTWRDLLWAVAAGLVLGGAAGNLIDRIGDQAVTDFISIGRWPSFNLADTAITRGRATADRT